MFITRSPSSLFFDTMVTVIPVLFIAITLQGGIYADLIAAYIESVRYRKQRIPLPQKAGAAIGAGYRWYILNLIIGTGLLSEIAAIFALYRQRTNWENTAIVLGGTLFLVFMAAAGPAGVMGRAMLRPTEEPAPADEEPRRAPDPVETSAVRSEDWLG